MTQPHWCDSGFVRDPDDDWRSEWTEDAWHKIKGQCLFHVNYSFPMTSKYDSSGMRIWGVKIPDLDAIVYRPEFEIAYEIWSSNVVSGDMGGILTQKDGHPTNVYMALYDPNRVKLAEFKHGELSGPPSYRNKTSCDVEIKPDTGIYTIDWTVSRTEDNGTADRQPTGMVEGNFKFDSNADLLRMRLRVNYNI